MRTLFLSRQTATALTFKLQGKKTKPPLLFVGGNSVRKVHLVDIIHPSHVCIIFCNHLRPFNEDVTLSSNPPLGHASVAFLILLVRDGNSGPVRFLQRKTSNNYPYNTIDIVLVCITIDKYAVCISKHTYIAQDYNMNDLKKHSVFNHEKINFKKINFK